MVRVRTDAYVYSQRAVNALYMYVSTHEGNHKELINVSTRVRSALRELAVTLTDYHTLDVQRTLAPTSFSPKIDSAWVATAEATAAAPAANPVTSTANGRGGSGTGTGTGAPDLEESYASKSPWADKSKRWRMLEYCAKDKAGRVAFALRDELELRNFNLLQERQAILPIIDPNTLGDLPVSASAIDATPLVLYTRAAGVYASIGFRFRFLATSTVWRD